MSSIPVHVFLLFREVTLYQNRELGILVAEKPILYRHESVFNSDRLVVTSWKSKWPDTGIADGPQGTKMH